MNLKLFQLLVLVVPFNLVLAQKSFYKVYPSVSYAAFQDVLAISDNEHVIITEAAFFRINGQGEVIVKKEIKEGISSFLQSIQPDGNGNYWLVSHVFESLDDQKIVLYKINNNGQVLEKKSYTAADDSFENLKLIKTTQQKMFLVYKHHIPQSQPHIDIKLLDQNGDEVWTKETSELLLNRFAAQAGENGTIDLCFVTHNDYRVWVLNVDQSGAITKKEIHFQPAPGFLDITTNFCKAPDGGYLFGGDRVASEHNGDCFIYKADDNGNVLWKREMKIFMGEFVNSIKAVQDGYIVYLTTGYDDSDEQQSGDITLLKTDLQGNKIWIKSMGSPKRDYARQMLITNTGILLGSHTSYPGQVVPVAALCKTDLNGNLLSASFPFQLAPYSDLTKVAVNEDAPVKKLVQAVPADNGSYIIGADFLNPRDEKYYPYIIRSDKTGNTLWHKPLLNSYGRLKLVKRTNDGHFVAVTERKDIFTNFCDLIKFDLSGNIVWTQQFMTNNIKDLICTADGGYLLTGAEDISFIDFEVVLIKLDAKGAFEWKKTIGSKGQWETGRRIIETPEHDFIIAGNSQKEFDIVSSLHALKIDKNGNKIWSKTFTSGIATNLGVDVVITPDNGYVFLGIADKTPFLNKDVMLIKTDKQGNQLWEKTIDLYLTDDPASLKLAEDGGFLIAGSTGAPVTGRLEKFSFIMKTDDKGNKTGIRYFGKEALRTAGNTMLVLNEDEIMLFGSTEETYGKEDIYFVRTDNSLPPFQETNESISIYPNPAHSNTTLNIKSEFTGTVKVSIFDVMGKSIKVLSFLKASADLKEDIPVYYLSAGTYFFAVEFNGEKHIRKMEVMRR